MGMMSALKNIWRARQIRCWLLKRKPAIQLEFLALHKDFAPGNSVCRDRRRRFFGS